MRHTLVICIGNPARGDDGVGRRVAHILGERARGAHVISTHALDIAMAGDVAGATTVIFVDGERREEPLVEIRSLAPESAGGPSPHALAPGGLLSIAKTLYGATPEALLVSVAAPLMGQDEGLSEAAEAASREAAVEVLRIVESRAQLRD